jgi:hypothetical protein
MQNKAKTVAIVYGLTLSNSRDIVINVLEVEQVIILAVLRNYATHCKIYMLGERTVKIEIVKHYKR